MRSRSMFSGLGVMLLFPAIALAQAPPPPPLTPLPPPPAPPGNPVTAAKASLGKVLFWDEQVSSSRTIACGSCHQAASGGSDHRSILASAHATNPGLDGVTGSADDITGSPGVVLRQSSGAFAWSPVFGLNPQVTPRLAPSHINAAYSPVLFWDGRATGSYADPVTGTVVLPNGAALESQSAGPPLSSTEMGHQARDWNDVVARIQDATPLALSASMPAAMSSYLGGRSYPDLFAEAFGAAGVTASRIAMAIATYERTLFSTQTPFDSLIAGTPGLTPQENAGFQLFGRLRCAVCHAGALTSDHAFHYTGVRPADEDSARMLVTHDPADLGKVRTPGLRNVALRRTYMHDGRFSTLADVVDFYDRGGDFSAPNKDPLIVPLHLTPQQKAALVAFMSRPLTDPRVAAATSPFDQPALYSESNLVPFRLGGGVAGTSGVAPEPVALEPAIAGNPSFTVGIDGAPGGAGAVLVIDESEPATGAGIPSNGSFARQAITLGGAGASDGFGSVTLAIPDDAAMLGKTLFGRWYVDDPGAPGGVAASAAFRFRIFGPHGSGLSSLTVGTAPSSLRLSIGGPNPFARQTRVNFELSRASRVRLGVYDVSGRLRRTLLARPIAMPGSYSLQWDGRDDAGSGVAAGVYFYRLQTERDVQSARVVRVP